MLLAAVTNGISPKEPMVKKFFVIPLLFVMACATTLMLVTPASAAEENTDQPSAQAVSLPPEAKALPGITTGMLCYTTPGNKREDVETPAKPVKGKPIVTPPAESTEAVVNCFDEDENLNPKNIVMKCYKLGPVADPTSVDAPLMNCYPVSLKRVPANAMTCQKWNSAKTPTWLRDFLGAFQPPIMCQGDRYKDTVQFCTTLPEPSTSDFFAPCSFLFKSELAKQPAPDEPAGNLPSELATLTFPTNTADTPRISTGVPSPVATESKAVSPATATQSPTAVPSSTDVTVTIPLDLPAEETPSESAPQYPVGGVDAGLGGTNLTPPTDRGGATLSQLMVTLGIAGLLSLFLLGAFGVRRMANAHHEKS